MTKPLDLETLRLKIGRELYKDTFKDDGGPAWLTLPPEVRDGFVRMVGVMFNVLFEEDPVQLAEFFVDEGLNKEEFDLIVMQARQQGKTFRMMQQQNAFVQRSALFTMAEAMLADLDNWPDPTEPELEQFQQYKDALQQIKEAADPMRIRENAAAVKKPLHTSKEWGKILGADGKPMDPGK